MTAHKTSKPATTFGPVMVAESGTVPSPAAQGPASPGALAQSARKHASVPGSTLEVIAAHMSEATLDRNVRAIIADLRNVGGQILRYHTYDSRRSPSGFVDLVCVGPGGVLWRELKRQSGKLTTAQLEWLQALAAAGQDAGVWRPEDLASGRITRELAALAGLPVAS